MKRIDLYAQQGWSGNVIPHLDPIDGDIYDHDIEWEPSGRQSPPYLDASLTNPKTALNPGPR